jgi:hypothetical protein
MFTTTKQSRLAAAAGLLVLLAGLTLGSGVPGDMARAAPAVDAATTEASPVGSVPDVAMRAEQVTGAYWTPERMRAAIPADTLSLQGTPQPAQAQAPQGPAGAIPPAGPAIGSPALATNATAGPAGATATGASFPNGEGLVPWPYNRWPYSTEGRVFYTQAGRDYTCSGAAINSPHKWLVMTAGQCVIQGGSRNGWDSSFMFCPGYFHGYCPFGKWYSRQLWSLNGWVDNDNLSYDIGAAIMWPNRDGVQIANVVGGQGLDWNQPVIQHFTAFGYPVDSRFTGNQLAYCAGSTSYHYGNDPGIACTMHYGFTGSSWYINYGANGGYRDGNSSYHFTSLPNVDFSPYYGTDVENLYTLVR